jgi:hypothetical protein
LPSSGRRLALLDRGTVSAGFDRRWGRGAATGGAGDAGGGDTASESSVRKGTLAAGRAITGLVESADVSPVGPSDPGAGDDATRMADPGSGGDVVA